MNIIGLGPWKWTYVLYFSFVCVYYLIDCFHVKDLVPRIIIYFQDLFMLPLSSNILLGHDVQESLLIITKTFLVSWSSTHPDGRRGIWS